MQNNNIIKPCVIERKWRHCNVFISSSPCNVFTVMYSCFWLSENEGTVQNIVVNVSKIFLCLFTFNATIFKQFRCRYSSGNAGEYCPLWRNFQPMTSRKYPEYLCCPLTRVITTVNQWVKCNKIMWKQEKLWSFDKARNVLIKKIK